MSFRVYLPPGNERSRQAALGVATWNGVRCGVEILCYLLV